MARVIVAPWEVSDRFRQAVVESHTPATLVRVFPGALEENNDIPLAELDAVTGGSVPLDSSASSRARCDVTLALEEAELLPDEAEDLLAPYGNELQVCRGVSYSADEAELVALGRFRIHDIDPSAADREMKLTAYDRAKILEEAVFTSPYSIAAGTQAIDAIVALIHLGLPGISLDFMEADVPLPELAADEGDNPWAMAQGIATSIGAELYFNALGVPVLRPIPVPTAQASNHDLVDGENGVLITADKHLTRDGAYNRIVVVGNNPSNDGSPPRGEAIDNDPTSPTYFYGSYGQVTYRADEYASFISTDTQAQDLANGILAQKRGLSRQISFGSLVDPSLTPADVVHIRAEQLETDELATIDGLTIPLEVEGEMSGQTRAVQEVI